MKTEYTKEVLNAIKDQEFYSEVADFSDCKVFDDILDFMHIHKPFWYKELGSWSSEFLHEHILSYIDMYDNEDFQYVYVLCGLYWDLSEEYPRYVLSYKNACREVDAYKHDYDEIEKANK
jgi:hypothetical protein